jgi:hypothetical protein
MVREHWGMGVLQNFGKFCDIDNTMFHHDDSFTASTLHKRNNKTTNPTAVTCPNICSQSPRGDPSHLLHFFQ